MTVGNPESGAEGYEQNCVKFYGAVYRQQSLHRNIVFCICCKFTNCISRCNCVC